MRITFLAPVVFLVLLAGGASADMKLKVEKSAMSVSSPGAAGTVVVWGRPGSVYGVHPINVMAYNKDLKAAGGGIVRPDGSFAVTVPGHGDDDIKVKFTAANGKEKSVGFEVPGHVVPPPAVVETTTVIDEGAVTRTTTVLPPYTVEKRTVTEDVEVVE